LGAVVGRWWLFILGGSWLAAHPATPPLSSPLLQPVLVARRAPPARLPRSPPLRPAPRPEPCPKTHHRYKHSGIRDDGCRIFDRLLAIVRDSILVE